MKVQVGVGVILPTTKKGVMEQNRTEQVSDSKDCNKTCSAKSYYNVLITHPDLAMRKTSDYQS